MKYSSEYRSFILEDEDGIEKSVDEIVDRYYSNVDNYFILDKRAVVDVSEEYHESRQNAMKSQLSDRLDEENLEKNAEEPKDLFGANKTNKLLSSDTANDACSHSGNNTNENGDAEDGVFNQVRKAAGAAISIEKTTVNESHLSAKEIDKFFFDEPNSIYRSPPEHTLDESPCKSIISITNDNFYFCKMHPDIQNIYLESIEHHIKYKDPKLHESEIFKLLNIQQLSKSLSG
jgi:galactose-1-phosphate uridylyltransferase